MAEHNIRNVAGRIFDLHNRFNGTVNSNLAYHNTLNKILEINHDNEQLTDLNDRILGWYVVGNGAMNKKDGLSYTDTELGNMLPIRYVPLSADLDLSERAKYRLRRIETNNRGEDFVAYYAKAITPTEIFARVRETNTNFETKSDIVEGLPEFVAESPDPGKPVIVASFTDLEIGIGKEIKEYFEYNLEPGQTTDTVYQSSMASFNEIGLVAAKDVDTTKPGGISSGMELRFAEIVWLSVFDRVVFIKPDSKDIFTINLSMG